MSSSSFRRNNSSETDQQQNTELSNSSKNHSQNSNSENIILSPKRPLHSAIPLQNSNSGIPKVPALPNTPSQLQLQNEPLSPKKQRPNNLPEIQSFEKPEGNKSLSNSLKNEKQQHFQNEKQHSFHEPVRPSHTPEKSFHEPARRGASNPELVRPLHLPEIQHFERPTSPREYLQNSNNGKIEKVDLSRPSHLPEIQPFEKSDGHKNLSESTKNEKQNFQNEKQRLQPSDGNKALSGSTKNEKQEHSQNETQCLQNEKQHYEKAEDFDFEDIETQINLDLSLLDLSFTYQLDGLQHEMEKLTNLEVQPSSDTKSNDGRVSEKENISSSLNEKDGVQLKDLEQHVSEIPVSKVDVSGLGELKKQIK